MIEFPMRFRPSNTTILFSHGFGVMKDARGLFTFLTKELSSIGYKTKQFNYNKFDRSTNELFAIPFSEQAKILQKQIDQLSKNRDNESIFIIGHSQGSFIPTLCQNLSEVNKVIGVSPFFHTDINDIRRRYTSRAGDILDFDGVSRRKRSDGTTTIIPSEYWKERFNTDIISLYNNLALRTNLTLIYAMHDEVIKFSRLREIKYSRIINVDGDHDFSGKYRDSLLHIIQKELEYCVFEV